MGIHGEPKETLAKVASLTTKEEVVLLRPRFRRFGVFASEDAFERLCVMMFGVAAHSGVADIASRSPSEEHPGLKCCEALIRDMKPSSTVLSTPCPYLPVTPSDLEAEDGLRQDQCNAAVRERREEPHSTVGFLFHGYTAFADQLARYETSASTTSLHTVPGKPSFVTHCQQPDWRRHRPSVLLLSPPSHNAKSINDVLEVVNVPTPRSPSQADANRRRTSSTCLQSLWKLKCSPSEQHDDDKKSLNGRTLEVSRLESKDTQLQALAAAINVNGPGYHDEDSDGAQRLCASPAKLDRICSDCGYRRERPSPPMSPPPLSPESIAAPRPEHKATTTATIVLKNLSLRIDDRWHM
ncbi:hypothetical protein NMY22_g4731 [Coprinellus aureogranulatus]|nr:hypothetical protein NMY22_g4731 [Coprinellus aureogranulatus]